MPTIDTSEAARRLKISRRRVLALIKAGRLLAKRIGQRQWLIESADLKAVKIRKNGRPAA